MTALTDEEKIVLEMYCKGYNTAAIENAVARTEYALKTIHKIEDSIGASGLETLITYAIEQGLEVESPFGQWSEISEHQEKILRLAAKGMSNPEIARALEIFKGTVFSLFEKIYNKFTICPTIDTDCHPKNTAVSIYLVHQKEIAGQRSAA